MLDLLNDILCQIFGCRETVVDTLPLAGLEKTVCSRCGITSIRSIKEPGVQPNSAWPRH
jgi:hypothetical protein